MIMMQNPYSNADVAKQKIYEMEKFNLYPDPVEEDDEPQILKTLREQYETIDRGRFNHAQHSKIKETLLENLLTDAIYYSVLEPVLESQYTKSRGYELGYNLINDFVQEQGAYNVYDDFKYKNIYLYEIANTVGELYDGIVHEMDEKIKQGLPENEIYNIEDESIKSYLKDAECRIPKNLNNTIKNRVEKALDHFIDEKRQSQMEIKQIYDKASEKINQYKMMDQMNSDMGMTAMGDDQFSGQDPELMTDQNLNAQMDSQEGQQMMDNPNPGVGAVQQEAAAIAREQESIILERNYNVFEGIMRILVEATHNNESLNEAYTDINSNRINMESIMEDAKVMYTFLECANTLRMVNVDSDYIKKMFTDMKQSMMSV